MRLLERFTPAGRARQRAAVALYQEVMQAALDPELFDRCALPDRFDTRAALVSVMTALYAARLARIGTPQAASLVDRLNRKVLDGFDAAYREQGVGDHSIARKVRTLAEHHTGLGRAVFEALQAQDTAVEKVHAILARNGLATGTEPILAQALVERFSELSARPDAAWLSAPPSGRLPPPH